MCPVSAPDDEITLDPGLTRAATVGPSQVTPRPDAFAPGAIIAGRYRVIALLGRGGMGEVYRAEDLTLEQPVALKFLPEAVAAGDARLSQFHNELRVARQVSHKNVCRLYDLGDANGRRFLTMEYVDGEDLGSLLRRIGRVPHDKAVQIARQLCAGVAAAHERGVLHRDLKPANVMIDGEGNVRITDFGIATVARDTVSEFAGTPQYMAPEQFAGKGASIKSDIYALGLTLFEVFTGKRAQESGTLEDLKKFHETGTHTTPSSIVRDLDPAVERLILRCLERDPDRRPSSALVVAAALPGADPLAAALAAGETPSPEILAAAGEADALPVGRAIAAVGFVVAGLLVFAMLSSRTSIVARTPLDRPADVLIDRAEALLASLGYPRGSGDRASDFVMDEDYIEWLRENRRTPGRWDVLSSGNPSAVLFWYRTSPRDMVPLEDSFVSMADPAMTDTDMRLVVLDPQGRLREFRSVPPQQDAATAPPDAPKWDVLFEAAGLTSSAFVAVPSEWTPRDFADTRAAWKGPLTGNPDVEVRVEAAAYRGKPVFFQVIGPWTRPSLMDPEPVTTGDRVMLGLIVTVLVVLITAAMVLARRNLRAGRADRRGAARLAAYIGIAGAAAWLLGAHHVSSLDSEVDVLIRRAGLLTFISMTLWTFYIALEPAVRRFWPDGLLGWSRLLAGHFKDPRVGRDVLAGLIFGVALALSDLDPRHAASVARLCRAASQLRSPRSVARRGRSAALGADLRKPRWHPGRADDRTAGGPAAIRAAMELAEPRRDRDHAFGFVPAVHGRQRDLIYLFPLVNGALLTFVAVRFGLLPLTVTYFVWDVVVAVPITTEVSHWAAGASNWTLAVLLALTLFAFYASRAGQPLLGAVLKDEAI